MIEVEYEELPVLIDPLARCKTDAPLIHPNVADYKGLLHKIDTPSNVFVSLVWKKGVVEEGFRQSDVIVENTYTVPAIHQAYIEPHCSLVRVNADGTAEVWSSNKSPFNMRDQVGNALQIAPASLIVHPATSAAISAARATATMSRYATRWLRKTGRPVKLLIDYTEELMAGNPRHGAVIKIKTGVKKNGLMIAEHIEFIFDSGAYGAYRPQGYLVGAHDAPGPYRVPNCLIEEKYVYTNTMPAGYMRAPGHLQGIFASESHMDVVAKRLNMNPIEFRRMNFMHDGDPSPLGACDSRISKRPRLSRALSKCRSLPSPRKKIAAVAALSAIGFQKAGSPTRVIKIDEQGTVTLSSAVTDTGPGVFTMMRQIVGEELKVPLDAIAVEMLDSDKVLKDTGVRGSSSTRVHGGSALNAAQQAREEILQIAGVAMQASAGRTPAVRWRRDPWTGRAAYDLREIARANGGPILVEGHYANMSDGPEASLVAQVAEVEVDGETGEVRVTKLTTAHNTGAILNPLTHQGQIDGSVAMGFGYGLVENLAYDESGKVLAANLGEYKIPNIKDMPPLHTTILQSELRQRTYNSMSIGETALIPTAAAIANAVADAVGVRITSLPITAEKVLNALEGRWRSELAE